MPLYETPLDGLVQATDAQYMKALAVAVDSLGPTIGVPLESGGIIIPPMQTQVAALGGIIETASGMPLGSIVDFAGDIEALANATSPGAVVGAVGGVLGGTTEIIADVATALGVAADVVDVVPIVGSIVGGLLNIIGSIVEGAARAEADARKTCSDDMDVYCHEWAQRTGSAGVRSTSTVGGGGGSPADHYRQLAHRYQTGSKRYPANTSTLVLMLCGGAAGDFGLTESTYQNLVTSGNPSGGFDVTEILPDEFSRAPGLPYETRERLWKLVQALFACVQKPLESGEPAGHVIGDQGRSILPIIMAILSEARRRGQINPQLLKVLAREAFWYQRKACAIGVKMENTKMVEKIVHEGCSSRIATGLSAAFDAQIQTFGSLMQGAELGFWNYTTQSWNEVPFAQSAGPSISIAAAASPGGMCKVGPMRARFKATDSLLTKLKAGGGSLSWNDMSRRKPSGGGGGGMLLLGGAAVAAFLLLRRK